MSRIFDSRDGKEKTVCEWFLFTEKNPFLVCVDLDLDTLTEHYKLCLDCMATVDRIVEKQEPARRKQWMN